MVRFAEKSWLTLAVLLLISCPVSSLPLLGQACDVEGIHIYPDSQDTRVFYYAPGKLVISEDADGKPDLSFLQMRYTGTTATGHKGEFHTRSLLSFKVKMTGITGNILAAVREKLRSKGVLNPQLKALPIRKVETVLNYTPIAAQDNPEENSGNPKSAGSGSLEEPEKARPSDGYWSERVFNISPDEFTSQALWEAFQTGKVMLSLSYIFYSDGVPPAQEQPEPKGDAAGTGQPDAASPGNEKREQDPHIVLVDTVEVTVDAVKYPECFKKIEINESIPPAYAALSVYCFDFNNSLRPDLSMKIVEVEAKSVTGKPVTVRTQFTSSSPDLFSASLKFPFAVLIRQPYRYRVREVTMDGIEKLKPWREGKSWSQILDITTPPEEQPKPPANELDSGETQ